jgi:hypothetical protein
MPIRRGKDWKGSYMAWGRHGKHYYYIPGDRFSRERAYRNALRQAQAAYSHGYNEH